MNGAWLRRVSVQTGSDYGGGGDWDEYYLLADSATTATVFVSSAHVSSIGSPYDKSGRVSVRTADGQSYSIAQTSLEALHRIFNT